MAFESLSADMVEVLRDLDANFGATLSGTVYRVVQNHATTPPKESSTAVDTATFLVTPINDRNVNRIRRDHPGVVEDATHALFVATTADVAVKDRVRQSASDPYYDVLAITTRPGHVMLVSRRTAGRTTV